MGTSERGIPNSKYRSSYTISFISLKTISAVMKFPKLFSSLTFFYNTSFVNFVKNIEKIANYKGFKLEITVNF